MNLPLYRVVLLLVIFSFTSSCSPGDDQPKPDDKPKPTEPPPPPAPKPPKGTDYSKPGSHGKVGVTTDDDTVEDKTFSDWGGTGGLMGSNIAAMNRWDTTQNLKKCPTNPIYVYGDVEASSKPQCRDGKGYANLCKTSQKRAWKRAVNVIRSCERIPSCRGRIVATGEKWRCIHREAIHWPADELGDEVNIPERWEKECWTQYKVVCIQM